MPTTPQNTPASPPASARDLIIKVSNLTKVFKDFWMRPRVKAVQDVNLEVRQGEVFGLLGPNGSGKSTTIKLLLGLLHPTSGHIAVFGKRPDEVATKALIGYLPEESYLYRFLNAHETLDYYGRLFHLPGHVRKARIESLLHMVGLEGAQHRPVGEYSKGMQRRIGLAQALINQPKLLILDEPTTGLDPIGTRQIKDLIIKLKDKGITILLCSHLLADVEDVCDRVAIMYGGRVIEHGQIDDLLTQKDVTTIETGNLDDQTVEQIEQVLANHGKHIERVSYRRQTLEKKFLDLVERERSKGSATSGAGSGGRIADFLVDERAGHMPEDQEAAAVLDELTKPAPKPEPKREEVEAQAADDLATAREEEEQVEVLSLLSVSPEPQASEPAGNDESSPEDEDADLSVLEGLVSSTPAAPAKVEPKRSTPEPAKASPPKPEPVKPEPVKVESVKVESVKVEPPTAKVEPVPQVKPVEPPKQKEESAPPPASKLEAVPEPSKPAPTPPPAVKKSEPASAPAKPQPTQPPPRMVSKESGEAGTGLIHNLEAEEAADAAEPFDDPPSPPPPRSSSEQPDETFLKALEDVDPLEDDNR
ncbi:MAG: ATP-binding cassette domain-containing protein [Phycisphaeraceae bacterium]